MTEREELPRKILSEVCDVLKDGMGIPAGMSQHDKAPCINLYDGYEEAEEKVGQIIFFKSSGDYRLFLRRDNRQKTFRSPDSLLTFLEGYYESALPEGQ